jgi:hypothetical protein
MRRIDTEAVKATFRTVGALMMGNAFVGYFVLDKRGLLNLAAVGILGLLVIVLASIKKLGA